MSIFSFPVGQALYGLLYFMQHLQQTSGNQNKANQTMGC